MVSKVPGSKDHSLLQLLRRGSPLLVPPSTDEFGTQLFHKEQGDASNAKTGAYGYRDANGIFRTVKYVADANGFPCHRRHQRAWYCSGCQRRCGVQR
ncbi:hypothetical protein MTO96_043518 [Rhipicephalus appendiculatus]